MEKGSKKIDLMWVAYIFLLPFYVFRSGSVQPATFAFAAALGVLLARSKLRLPRNQLVSRALNSPMAVMALLVVLVLVIDGFWSIRLGSGEPIGFAIYYVFNFGLFIYGYIALRENRFDFVNSTLYAVYASVAFQVAASFVIPAPVDESREALFFNGCNQLAYWALSCACIVVVAQLNGFGRTTWNLLALAACAWLTLLSLSKAGVGCIAILMLIVFGTMPRRLLVGITLGTFLLFVVAGQLGYLTRINDRFASTNQVFDNQIEGRGYDRIVNYPEYMVLGAGEGEVGRFRGALSDLGAEMHSAPGTMLFSYGVTGLALYATFLFLVLMRSRGAQRLVVLLPLVYGFTHNGLRFSIAWIFFLFVIGCYVEIRLRAAAQARSPQKSVTAAPALASRNGVHAPGGSALP